MFLWHPGSSLLDTHTTDGHASARQTKCSDTSFRCGGAWKTVHPFWRRRALQRRDRFVIDFFKNTCFYIHPRGQWKEGKKEKNDLIKPEKSISAFRFLDLAPRRYPKLNSIFFYDCWFFKRKRKESAALRATADIQKQHRRSDLPSAHGSYGRVCNTIQASTPCSKCPGT